MLIESHAFLSIGKRPLMLLLVPSMLQCTTSVYMMEEGGLPHHTPAFLLFPDATLTVDNVTEVMDLVSADKVLEVWRWMGVYEPTVKMISEHLSTAKEKTRACVEHYLKFYHGRYPKYRYPCWRAIADALFTCGEMTAAKRVKLFWNQNGKG